MDCACLVPRTQHALAIALGAILLSQAGCATARSREFSTDALAVGAEIGVEEVGGSAQLERHPVMPLSEEAAIYAKRLADKHHRGVGAPG